CSTSPNRAPVEERVLVPRSVAAATPALPAASAADAKGAPVVVDSNSGKPGYYTVKSGDTLIRIGLDNGQNWKDLMRWNNLSNPNLLEAGQVLRINAPGAAPAAATSRP